MNVLIVAPSGPPKNSAEALQFRRLLIPLDAKLHGIWLTTPAGTRGWVQADPTLELTLKHIQRNELSFPGGKLCSRFFHSRFGTWLHQPDQYSWIRCRAHQALQMLPEPPDIIYSRSRPMSSALLAARLAKQLGKPYLMHLSDIWADSSQDTRLESMCMHAAHLISLTNSGQVKFYRKRYPHMAEKFFVSPNMYPSADEQLVAPVNKPALNAPLRMVYAGALYPLRKVHPLIDAVKRAQLNENEVKIDLFGHADPMNLAALKEAPPCMRYHGHVPIQQARQVQQEADIIINIDLLHEDVAHQSNLPSKMLDAMVAGKPQLCLTYPSSPVAKLCEQGFGWAVSLNMADEIAAQLKQCVSEREQIRSSSLPALPEMYHAEAVADDLIARMQGLLKDRRDWA